MKVEKKIDELIENSIENMYNITLESTRLTKKEFLIKDKENKSEEKRKKTEEQNKKLIEFKSKTKNKKEREKKINFSKDTDKKNSKLTETSLVKKSSLQTIKTKMTEATSKSINSENHKQIDINSADIYEVRKKTLLMDDILLKTFIDNIIYILHFGLKDSYFKNSQEIEKKLKQSMNNSLQITDKSLQRNNSIYSLKNLVSTTQEKNSEYDDLGRGIFDFKKSITIHEEFHESKKPIENMDYYKFSNLEFERAHTNSFVVKIEDFINNKLASLNGFLEVNWELTVFSSEEVTFSPNMVKEEREKAEINSWETKQPGRKNLAENTRIKNLLIMMNDSNEPLETLERKELNDIILMKTLKLGQHFENNTSQIQTTNYKDKKQKNKEKEKEKEKDKDKEKEVLSPYKQIISSSENTAIISNINSKLASFQHVPKKLNLFRINNNVNNITSLPNVSFSSGIKADNSYFILEKNNFGLKNNKNKNISNSSLPEFEFNKNKQSRITSFDFSSKNYLTSASNFNKYNSPQHLQRLVTEETMNKTLNNFSGQNTKAKNLKDFINYSLNPLKVVLNKSDFSEKYIKNEEKPFIIINSENDIGKLLHLGDANKKNRKKNRLSLESSNSHSKLVFNQNLNKLNYNYDENKDYESNRDLDELHDDTTFNKEKKDYLKILHKIKLKGKYPRVVRSEDFTKIEMNYAENIINNFNKTSSSFWNEVNTDFNESSININTQTTVNFMKTRSTFLKDYTIKIKEEREKILTNIKFNKKGNDTVKEDENKKQFII